MVAKEFVDDGYSGSNFNRPGFHAMLNHLKDGTVNMVITKDLSRLGRDMAESSMYAERYFPERGIQYIAISDNFDSSLDNLMAPFQFAMNDVYLRDTSRKIKQVLSHKKSEGKYASCPPFGYKKHSRSNHLLVPDENTAPIVKHIFALAIEGMSTNQIVKKLNEENAIPPLKYRVFYRDDFSGAGAAHASDEWNRVTVKRILQNKVYLGHTILGKTKKASLKSKVKLPVPKEEWYVTENTHEPLVTQEVFDLAQAYLKLRTKENVNDHFRNSIFSGLVFCANCGGAMCSAGSVYRGERKKYWYLSCVNIPKRSKHHCDNGARIRYEDLMELVRKELNTLIAMDQQTMDQMVQHAIRDLQAREQYKKASAEEIGEIEARIQQIDQTIAKLYLDNAKGKISDSRLERMVSLLEEETNSLQDLYQTCTMSESKEETLRDSYSMLFAIVKQYAPIQQLTREILIDLIDKIEIGKKERVQGTDGREFYQQKVRIFYRFVGPFQEDPMVTVAPRRRAV